MLAIDADGDGQITERKEIVFGDWDPSAKDDMAALRSVFDTNDNGKLGAGDAEFAKFRVVVTNADGTTTVKTLTELGIASIDLITDATQYTLADGSSIDGLTTYTKTDGTTGNAAAVTLATESQGYALGNSTVVNPDGSTTVTNVARAADGSIANVTVTTTSADGSLRTNTFDHDGDGVVDQVQTVLKVSNGDGSRTETITNRNGGDVLIDGTQTTTSADGNTVAISRDTRGGGYFNETETRVTSGGSLTITLAELNPNGSLIRQTTTTTTADGLTRTESYDRDGNAAADLVVTEATVVNGDGSRTEMVTNKSGNGTLLSKTVTDIDPTGQNRTIVTDADGDGDTDLTTSVTLVNQVDGSTVTTESDMNANGSLRGRAFTSISGDSLTYVTKTDRDGDGTYDVTRSDVTVINGDGSRTQTVTETNADGSLRDRTVIVKGADGRGRDIQIDVDGDGNNERTRTIVIAGDGSSVDTTTELAANGAMWARTIVSTSADGLTTITQVDTDGNGIYETVTSSVTVKNGDGSSTVTDTVTNADASSRGKSVTNTSADGLSVTVQTDRTGDGVFDLTRTDVTMLAGDGSYTRTVTDKFGNGALAAKDVTSVSADRDTTSATRDLNGDGTTNQTQTIIRQSNGDMVDTVTNLADNASVINRTVTTTSANGLSSSSKSDINGDGVYDAMVGKATTLNADGSRTEETTTTAGTSQVAKQTVTVSGNGLSITTDSDINGDNVVDTKSTDVTVLNANGSSTRTLSDLNNNGSLRSRVTIVTSDDGLATDRAFDFDGNTVTDLTETDVTVLNADGSTTRTVSRTDVHGLRDQSITTTSADGRTVTASSLANGSVDTKQQYSRTIETDGRVVETVSNLSASDVLLNRTRTTTSADGLNVTSETDQNADGTYDYSRSSITTLNADGSRTQTVTASNAAGLVSKEVTTVSATGLSSTVQIDGDGDGTFDRTTASQRVLNQDGSVVDTVTETSANGSQISQTVTTTSADRETTTIARSRMGVNVQNETRVVQANGDTVATVISKDTAGTVLSTVTTTTSANGLSKVVQTKNGAGTIIDTQTTTTVLNADGSRTETMTQVGAVNSTIVTNVSADGLTRTRQSTLTGVTTTNAYAQDKTVLNPDGSRTQTIEVHSGTSLAGALKDKAVVVTSDDGLSTNMTLDVNGDNVVDNTFSSVTSTDGSKVETMTYNMLTGGLRRKDVTSTSTDGRTVTLARDTDGDGVTDLTVTTVRNADGSVTESRVGAVLGGVPAFSQVSRTEVDLDGGTKIVTDYFNGAGTQIGRTSITNAPNGLEKTVEFDLNGDGIVDKNAIKTLQLNADGSTTETERYTWSGGIPSSTRITVKSADGSVTTTTLDLDGNGIVEQSSTTTLTSDGSIIHTFTTFDNDTGAQTSQQSINIGINGQTLEKFAYDSIVSSLQRGRPHYVWREIQKGGKNDSVLRQVVRRDYELVYKVQTNQVLDTSTIFVGANDSNQWVRTVSGTQVANATHFVDANNVETWSWNIVNATLWGQTSRLPIVAASGSIQIDVATRNLYLDRADNIFSAALAREMSADERETLAQYITGGVLNEAQLAANILASSEFTSKYGTTNDTEFVIRLLTNAIGNLPSAAIRDYYVGQLAAGTMTRATALVALGSAIESGQITRSESQNGFLNSTVSYSTAAAGVTVDLANTANNTGAAQGDDYVLVRNVAGSGYNDTLKGDANNNMLSGGAGNDTLDGGNGNDNLSGGIGNDALTGGSGTDTASYDSEGAGVRASLTTGAAAGSTSGADSLSGIENLVGSSHDDVLIGDANANMLTGGAGGDVLIGGLGNDTYRLNLGFGQDEIFDVDNSWVQQVTAQVPLTHTLTGSYSYTTWKSQTSGGHDGGDTTWTQVTKTVPVSMTATHYHVTMAPVNVHNDAGTNDILEFGAGITADDLAFEFRGTDLYIGVRDPSRPNAKASALSDSVRLVNWLDPLDRIETLKFANGTTATIASAVGTIPSAPSINLINGTAGNDTLTGTLHDDRIVAAAGDDVLAGAAGDDRLEGGEGNDTYVFSRGDAWDIILDENKYLDTTVTAQPFNDQYQQTYTYTYYVREGGHDGGSFVQRTGSATVTFTDSGTVTNTTSQYKIEDGGLDTLSFGAGITIEDVAVKIRDNDLLIVLRDPTNPSASFWELTDRLRIENWSDIKSRIEKFQFADGTIVDVASMITADTGGEADDVLVGDGAASWLAGSGGNDTLSGMSGNDVLIGGTGDDLIAGGGGADRLYGGVGKDAADYSAASLGVSVDLTAGTASGGDAAGDVLDGIESLIGSNSSDTLTGDSGYNELVGGGGADHLDGGNGDDVLAGGTGDDALVGGAGADTLDGGSGTDTAQFAGAFAEYQVTIAGTGAATVTDLEPGVNGDTGTDSVVNVERLVFSDGRTIYLDGTNNRPDALADSAGTRKNRSLTILAATLLANDSDVDQQNITIESVGDAVNGTVSLDGSGNVLFTPTADFIGTASFSYTIVDTLGATHSAAVTISVTPPPPPVESSVSSVLPSDAEELILTGSADIDGTGNALDNTITGNSGVNGLYGLAGNDTLIGGADDDHLDGGAGNDVLDGGAGDDEMIGGAGDDTYIVDRSNDNVSESSGQGTDTVLSSDDFTLTNNIENLVLTGEACPVVPARPNL